MQTVVSTKTPIRSSEGLEFSSALVDAVGKVAAVAPIKAAVLKKSRRFWVVIFPLINFKY
jgi:hypothetical protein